jgi:HD-GYP domain-containing protein (c-di-GMP phosphodiesterase class II)
MSETQELLGKIVSLRQRLEKPEERACDSGLLVPSLPRSPEPAGHLAKLERQVQMGTDHNALIDSSLRQMKAMAGGATVARTLPAQLTSRARRLLERGRELLTRLRQLADEFHLAHEDGDLSPALASTYDPLLLLYRETAAMTDTSLRMIQAFPDAPSAQLRLCTGLEAIVAQIGRQLDTLAAHLDRRRREETRIETLGELLALLEAGKRPDVQAFIAIAEAILSEAQQAAPLRFLSTGPDQPARWVACHSLTVAQVIARVIRHDVELRGRQVEPVLAALVHDAGMLRVPAAILAQPGPLDDFQRRVVEGHCRAGADLATQLLPQGAWLAESVGGHHERLDGTGYPDGLRELQIGSLTRLLAVCDVYAALCTPRSYRPARDPRTALTDTLLLAEQGALCRMQAERLLCLSFYPVGSVVELADGAVGVVVAIHQDRQDLQAPARPVVALLLDARSQPLPVPRCLDLAQCEGHSIVRTLPPTESRTLLGRHYPQWL